MDKFKYENNKTKNDSFARRVKQRFKKAIQKYKIVWNTYQGIKTEIRRLVLIKYFIYDAKNSYLHMHWGIYGKRGYVPLASEVLFNYHKIEKALSLPVAKRLFGLEAVERLFVLLAIWNRQGFSLTDPIYLGALDTLSAYEKCLCELNLDPENIIYSKVTDFLTKYKCGYENSQPTTPIHVNFSMAEDGDFYSVFASLVSLRRSVRDFSMRSVETAKIENSVKLAQMSPSACNRQPCRIYIIDDPEKKKRVLSFQNGNLGFGHTIPVVAIITADEQCFFDASERHEAYIDGGLFSMTLAYALQSQGLSNCCLNWCVPPAHDAAVHQLFGIARSERIIMLMAIGYASESAVVPKSQRKSVDWILRNI